MSNSLHYMMFRWLLSGYLIPSFSCLLLGTILLVLSLALFQMRSAKLFIFNPIHAVSSFSSLEKKMLVAGFILILVGIASFIVISSSDMPYRLI